MQKAVRLPKNWDLPPKFRQVGPHNTKKVLKKPCSAPKPRWRSERIKKRPCSHNPLALRTTAHPTRRAANGTTRTRAVAALHVTRRAHAKPFEHKRTRSKTQIVSTQTIRAIFAPQTNRSWCSTIVHVVFVFMESPHEASPHRPHPPAPSPAPLRFVERGSQKLFRALNPISGVLGGAFLSSRNAHRPADLTPPAPLSNSALLRNAAWRGGSQKLVLALSPALGGIGGLCPPIVTWVECKSGSRSEPVFCTDRGRTRVSAYCLYQSTTLRGLEGVFGAGRARGEVGAMPWYQTFRRVHSPLLGLPCRFSMVYLGGDRRLAS